MNAVSSAIIVFAAAVMITGGSFVDHDQTQLFLQATGCVTGIIGFRAWFVACRENSDK